ncbi:MAG: nucleoside-diphosphate kinase [Candidatus Zixiibacteriota bacterium]
MNSELTLLLIKPDAVERNLIGEILSRIEGEKFKIMDLKMVQLKAEDAKRFYQVHQDKPFFDDLINFVSTGSVVVALLSKENAVRDLRKLVGNTDPQKSEQGTIRYAYGLDVTRNSVHASDSEESAKFEIDFFFNKDFLTA